VEYSLLKAAEEENVQIVEFTVAPYVSEGEENRIMNGLLSSK
jgi:hypothetical protein